MHERKIDFCSVSIERFVSLMKVVTRFAPSPTGYLHIGGARTALFNWLFARRYEGQFLLRIEDTDKKRSTSEAVDKIFSGLKWLGIESDKPALFQSDNSTRHIEIANKLLKQEKAYRCFCSLEELTEMRKKARSEGKTRLYDRRCRDHKPTASDLTRPSSIRIKMPKENETLINDLVQGEIKVTNDNLDDFIIIRPDGTPTYMLAVVVDDHDMGITHIIRGDDHLNNAIRQLHLFHACEWDTPKLAHIPLIHGHDGTKLSKRDGALGIDSYAEMGILSEAMNNYLLRLGWSHGDEEIISTKKAIKWFNLDAVGRAPSRFDMEKLLNLNTHYLRNSSNKDLVSYVIPILSKLMESEVSSIAADRIERGMPGLKQRSKTIVELAQNSLIYSKETPILIQKNAAEHLNTQSISLLSSLHQNMSNMRKWDQDSLEKIVRTTATENNIKLKQIAQPLRVALTGSTISPSIFEVMEVFGKKETLNRLKTVIKV